MTGPEHYREAEKLVRRAEDYDTEGAARAYAAAQVHATLALAAATALKEAPGVTWRPEPTWGGVAG